MKKEILNIREYIEVEQSSKHDLSWPQCPFNLKFISKKPVRGAGIYFITLNNEVVYLGKYQSPTGNIISDRWLKHLTTISARGYRLGLGSQSRLNSLRDAANETEFVDILNTALENNLKCEFFRDTGHTTSVNRVRFASAHWNFLKHLECDNFLNFFQFHLITTNSIICVKKLRDVISNIELNLLCKIKPACNKEFNSKRDDEKRKFNIPKSIAKVVMQEIVNGSGLTADRYILLKNTPNTKGSQHVTVRP